MRVDRKGPGAAPVGAAAPPVASLVVNSLAEVIDHVRNDIAKVARFVAVSAVTVPLGLFLLWAFLQTGMRPVLANVTAVAIATVPNYLLNRYWVWRKRGRNSMRREIAPFWAMAFIGLVVSTVFVWFVGLFTDLDLVFLAANLVAFGLVWVAKFFVIERFLFGHGAPKVAESRA